VEFFLTIIEEHRLGMFKYGVIKRISGSEEEVKDDWRKPHNEELHNFNSSLIITMKTKSKMRWTGLIPCVDEIRNAYSISVRKYKGNLEDLE
jgi:hypothetical protein